MKKTWLAAYAALSLLTFPVHDWIELLNKSKWYQDIAITFIVAIPVAIMFYLIKDWWND